MERDKMIRLLASLISEAWWIGTKDRATKMSIKTLETRCNQISKALGNGKLTPKELHRIETTLMP